MRRIERVNVIRRKGILLLDVIRTTARENRSRGEGKEERHVRETAVAVVDVFAFLLEKRSDQRGRRSRGLFTRILIS